MRKIEVIQWLVFEETQRAEAIIQGNALMRQFLGEAVISCVEYYINLSLPFPDLPLSLSPLSSRSLPSPSLLSACRKLKAARAVFNKIPPDSIEVVTRIWQSEVSRSFVQCLSGTHLSVCLSVYRRETAHSLCCLPMLCVSTNPSKPIW